MKIQDILCEYDTNGQAFRNWFGNSKVVDSAGNPLVVYHGTNSEVIKAFATDEGTSEGAAFFTPSTDVANIFADHERGNQDFEDGFSNPNILPVHLSIQNPKILAAEDVMSKSADGRLVHSFELMRAAVRKARKDGYDGLLIRGIDEGGAVADQYAAFNPNQIKSAVGNKGNFDPNNPDINEEL